MKYFSLVLTLLLLSFAVLSQPIRKTNSSVTLDKKIDTLSMILKDLEARLKSTSQQTTIKIDSLRQVAEILKPDSSSADKWMPSIIAFIAVAFASLISIIIANKQIYAQKENAGEQIKVARDQIKATSEMTIAQVHANNISQARIKWIQDLRDLLCEYTGIIEGINAELGRMATKPSQDELNDIYNYIKDKLKEESVLQSKISLFLNPTDKDHSNLQQYLKDYSILGLSYKTSSSQDLNNKASQIENIARKILKDTWEQAKNEEFQANENTDVQAKI